MPHGPRNGPTSTGAVDVAKTTPGTAHRHKDSRGKWVTEELPHTHDYTETAHPADSLTAAEVTAIRLAIANGGGGTTPVPTPPPLPTPGPVISNVSITVTGPTAATVSWSVSPNATGQVEYGTSPSFGSTTTLESTLLPGHTQPLSSLTPNVGYYFRVKSEAGGKLTVDSTRQFTTPQTTPPPAAGSFPPERSLPAGGSLPAVPTRPAKLVIYTDPFGTKGRIIGDTGQRHEYAKTQPWNADSSLLYFAYGGDLLNGTTYAVVNGSFGNPGRYNWHPTNPVLGYSTQSGETNLYKHDVTVVGSPVRTTLHNFGRAVNMGSGEGSISDNGWVALQDTSGNACAWNVDTNSGAGVAGAALWFSTGSVDSVTTSRDGTYVVAVDESGGQIRAYNRDGSGGHVVRYTARHGDTAVSTAGDQVWLQAGGEMHKLSLTNGPMTTLFPAGHAYQSCHVSGRGPSGWGLYSVFDTSAMAGRAGNDILVTVKLDGSQIVRVYGYGWRRGTSYETQPQAVISRDGTRVLTATDWGNSGTWAVILGVT